MAGLRSGSCSACLIPKAIQPGFLKLIPSAIFDFSAKGTYGTSGWMQPQEIPAVLDMVSDYPCIQALCWGC